MKRVLIALEEEVHEKIRLIAYNEHKSISAIIRELIEKGMITEV